MLTRHNSLCELILVTVLNEATVDAQEDMMIRSGFHYYTANMFQCETKIDKYYKMHIERRKMEPEEAMAAAELMLEAENKCNVIKDEELYEIDGYSFHTCVCNFIHPNFDFLYSLFDAYDKHSLLPFPGSLTEQPAYIMDILALFAHLKLEKEISDAENRARKEKQTRRRR